MNLKTAILVFANSAKEELQHKPIVGGEKLFSELTEQTMSIVECSGLPFFVFTEKNQIGRTFGERFVNAIQATYDLGFENVIAIGNDTPHLKKHHLLESAKQLENNKFVLGPSADGGFYLMGLPKSQFNPDIFLKLPWQSKYLSKRISLLIKASEIEIAKLPILYDIDTIEDLKTITKFNFNFSRILRSIIFQIVNSYTEIPQYKAHIKEHYHLQSFYNKGSPFLFNYNYSAI